MKLLYDARYIHVDFHDGVSRYSTELANELAKLTKVTFVICDERQLAFLPKNAAFVKIHKPDSVKEPFTAQVLNQYEPDVVFSPFQMMGSAGRNFKLILTLHDLIYYRHRKPPTDLPAWIRVGWRLFYATYTPQRLKLNGADIIATVSYTAQRDIEQARLTKRPVIVVPNAPQNLGHLAGEIKVGKPKNLIYMGGFLPYKNVETLIKGMKWLPGRTLHLLSRIDPARQAELEAIIPKGASVIFYGGVTDEKYAQLLSRDGALVTASLDEGYGLPVAEALAMGIPAVISDIGVFHEVAAGGALYFNPLKPRDFADQVTSLDSKVRRDEVIAAGAAYIKTFSWQNSARALLAAINSLA